MQFWSKKKLLEKCCFSIHSSHNLKIKEILGFKKDLEIENRSKINHLKENLKKITFSQSFSLAENNKRFLMWGG